MSTATAFSLRHMLDVDPLPESSLGHGEATNGTLIGIPLDWVETNRVLSVLIAFGCASIAVLISAYNIYGHLLHYGRPHLQLYIVRILVIVPMYALGSWLSLQFVNQAIYFDTIRDCYEAFVVYSFLALVLSFAGGEGTCVSKMQAASTEELKHPFPFCYILPPMTKDGRLVRGCKRGTLQFVFIKPFFAFISLIMLAVGRYETWQYQSLLIIVYNVSYSVALYCLLIFYQATKDILSTFNPVAKFFAVKSVIFLTFWQSSLIGIIPGITPSQAFAWKDLILCIEMVFFALVHLRAFSSKEFRANFEKMPESEVLENIKEVLSVQDIVADAYHNFMPAYQDYMLQGQSDEVKIRAKTYIAGNIDKLAPNRNCEESENDAEDDEEIDINLNSCERTGGEEETKESVHDESKDQRIASLTTEESKSSPSNSSSATLAFTSRIRRFFQSSQSVKPELSSTASPTSKLKLPAQNEAADVQSGADTLDTKVTNSTRTSGSTLDVRSKNGPISERIEGRPEGNQDVDLNALDGETHSL